VEASVVRAPVLVLVRAGAPGWALAAVGVTACMVKTEWAGIWRLVWTVPLVQLGAAGAVVEVGVVLFQPGEEVVCGAGVESAEKSSVGCRVGWEELGVEGPAGQREGDLGFHWEVLQNLEDDLGRDFQSAFPLR